MEIIFPFHELIFQLSVKSQNISCVFLNSNLKQMDLYQELRGRGQPYKQKKLRNAPFF